MHLSIIINHFISSTILNGHSQNRCYYSGGEALIEDTDLIWAFYFYQYLSDKMQIDVLNRETPPMNILGCHIYTHKPVLANY